MKGKIGLVVVIQISIIVSSFLTLVYFENQITFLGNTINISGKNRFLAELLYEKMSAYSIDSDPKPVIDAMNNLDDGIQALSSGRLLINSTSPNADFIMPVPSIFSNDLKQVQDKWASFKSVVQNTLNSKKIHVPIDSDLEAKKSQFVSAANELTYILGNYNKEEISNLILFQLLLLGFNISIHVFLLRVILNLVQHNFTHNLLIEQISSDNKQLSFDAQMSLLQKDILESFLDDMKDDLQKLKTQVKIMDSMGESNNNQFVFHEITQNLSIKIKQLSESKKELDDRISDYQKLNLKLEKSLSFISKSKSDTQTKKDVIGIIQSYVDSVNFLVSDGSIPSDLGRRLTDTMHEVIDSLERLKINKRFLIF